MAIDVAGSLENFFKCKVVRKEVIQDLWSGYGVLARYYLSDTELQQVVVKYIHYNDIKHPRGWDTNFAHERKKKSYQVEHNWYLNWANKCDTICKVPHFYFHIEESNELLFVMEDLNTSGYSRRLQYCNDDAFDNCLKWLANFHALFMEVKQDDLWDTGSYWHLKTRPSELEVMEDLELKHFASKIDDCLNSARYKTIIHGDAKLANFCFSDDYSLVSAVDFQYVGTGVGMKDLIYFMSSCYEENVLALKQDQILDNYFEYLNQALIYYNKTIDAADLESEWRSLYAYAWTDFFRFLQGWSPGHWKIHSYSLDQRNKVIRALKND